MSYTKSEAARLGSESESEEEILPVKGKAKKEPKGKKTPEKKSYRCDRCNFSSSSKAKYTKHAKSAHSGTIVQCDHCEFKTPYKWNLDRHYKNHLGGGVLCCHLCNFSCDIKQSLTVHLQNHHSNVPEEIIESVKRQQIPPRNQSINNPLLNSTTATPTVTNNNNNSTDSNSSSTAGTASAAAAEAAEKKVPPLRISRSLTGLSLGDENNSSGGSPDKEDESAANSNTAAAATISPTEASDDSTSTSAFSSADVRKCDLCDFEAGGEGGGSLMKKHLASAHGVHHKTAKHHHHHHHHHKRARSRSSSPAATAEQNHSPSPTLPVVPIPLPPKKSKGASSPRPGQSASSTSNSPAIHRSQSPLKASEAISAYGASCDHNNLQAVAPSSSAAEEGGSALKLNAPLTGQLQSSGEESAFTPVLSGDYTHHALSSSKKPKHRALAQFYQKIKPKFTTTTETESPAVPEEIPAQISTPAAMVVTTDDEDGHKNSVVCSSSKSNRCQYCRQRCKSTADLAAHMEKCSEKSQVAKVEDSLQTAVQKKVESVENPAWNGAAVQGPQHGVRAEAEEVDESEYDTKVQMLNGSASEMSDGLIGFETAPGVGAIHSGKLEEMEYQNYLQEESRPGSQQEEEGKAGNTEPEEEDEEMEEAAGGNAGNGKSGGKGGKAVTSRKVYRCPETDCSFWATTASRFHVHIVGHYNLKPFECSECHYKSNWRWDVNKHIRLKTPKDPKHASAKTLLTHESGQRDYRKYDNYLVAMSLTHSANAKAPDCSTSASKRTKGGNTVATPKSSPELHHQSSPGESGGGGKAQKESLPSGGYSVANSPSSQPPTSKKAAAKYAKALAQEAANFEQTAEELTAFEYHPSQNHTHHLHNNHRGQQDEHGFSGADAPASGSGEGRSFVETRMLAGGEIYQQQSSSLKADVGMSPTNNPDDERGEGGDDVPPSGFDLTLKRPHSRHAHVVKQEEIGEGKVIQEVGATQQPTTKKSRLKQIQQQQQELQQKLEREQQLSQEAGGATTEHGIQSALNLWQCIKCGLKHPNKELVSQHIREVHKPKKGDPVSLLAHNHLVQVCIPEQEVEGMMVNCTNVEEQYSRAAATISPAQKKEIYQQMFHENGKVLSCKYCPYSTGLLYEMEIHADHHLNKSTSYYSCPHCSYSVAVKSELQEHLRLHGETLPEIQNRVINSSTAISSPNDKHSMLSPTSTTEHLNLKQEAGKNRYHCVECPYATNDHSEFQYHKQCHEPHDYPFKCHRCSFNVSVKFHLLQHLRVHGIQIDEVGIPQTQSSPQQYPPEPVYEDVSNDYSPASQQQIQDEPLNLSIFANRKPVVIWENGVPMEGYKCSVCPQMFHDLNDLKEHELTNNHRSTNAASSMDSSPAVNYSNRQCESPPCEAMNLSFKPAEQTPASGKKSSQTNSKVSNNKRSGNAVNSAANIVQQQQTSTVPLSSPSPPSSVHSAELGSSGSVKGEKEYLYLCDECPARFFFEKELKIHHTFHENKSPFQCPKCTYSARQNEPHLLSHMRVHGTAYQEKTKALLTKFPRGKVNLKPASGGNNNNNGSTSATALQQAAVALSAASILNHASILNPNFNFQTAAAAMLSGGKFKPEMAAAAFGYPGEQAAIKNGLSIVCPKCPEKFYSTQAFQQHFEMHNSNGRADYRCRFCDYCAESRKSLTIHELVHTGTDLSGLEASALAGKLLTSPGTAFNPVSMMAMVAHQESPFTATAVTVGENENAGDKTVINVPEEAYEGNPAFQYPQYTKNGKIKTKRYKCMKCPSAFEKKDQYHTHIGLHGSNQKYKCTVCDYAVTYYANYIQHLKKHENQRNVPTELLALGRKRAHQDEDGNSGSGVGKLAKLAENGENSRSSNDSLESLENHHNGSNGHSGSLLKCSFCPFQCFEDVAMDNHLVHHQSNPNWLHVCNICTFRTSSKKSLKEHARLHLLSTFHLQQQQHQQQQQQQSHQNGVTNNNNNNNGHHNHLNGEYINGYDNHLNRSRTINDKRAATNYAEHEDSSNGSV